MIPQAHAPAQHTPSYLYSLQMHKRYYLYHSIPPLTFQAPCPAFAYSVASTGTKNGMVFLSLYITKPSLERV